MDFKTKYDDTKKLVLTALLDKGYSKEDAKMLVDQDLEFGINDVEELVNQIEYDLKCMSNFENEF